MTKAYPISQRGSRQEFDAVVLGTGVAGLSYAISLASKKPDMKIALLSKKLVSSSNSAWAQGGIASVSLTEDSFESHVQDTLKAGDGICDEAVVRKIIGDGPKAIEFLKENGVVFDVSAGTVDLAKEGGHSERRIYHVGDHTGDAMIAALTARLANFSNITVFEDHVAVNLITQIKTHTPGVSREVIGCYVLEEKTGLIHTFLSKVVVLATGGAGKVYRYTTNPDVATGDGVAMAYRAGARVGNMEFIQFHPTLLYHQSVNNFLITEALRGEGAYLRCPETGERFMKNYAPDEMELSTRDVVARAIFTEIEHSAFSYVYLDVRHLSQTLLETHFPSINKTLLGLGIDMKTDFIPVVPAAHYCCGGVLTDVSGKTDLTGLIAIGEVAFTGFHGANRLASNSLLEAIVMGLTAVESHAALLEKPLTLYKEISDWDSQSVDDVRRASQINAHWRSLRGEMTSYAGIVRTTEGLEDLLKLISARREMIETYYWQHVVTRDVIELYNIVMLAELIVRSSLMREESRGGHFREDFPHRFKKSEATLLRHHRDSRILKNAYKRPTE